MNNFHVIFSIFIAYEVFSAFGATTSGNGLQVISDDELMERMKSNEFVIALFCELFSRSNVQMDLDYFSKIKSNFCLLNITFL